MAGKLAIPRFRAQCGPGAEQQQDESQSGQARLSARSLGRKPAEAQVRGKSGARRPTAWELAAMGKR
jgi:hypothetical protein